MATFHGRRVSRRWHIVLTAAARAGVRFTLTSGRRTMAEQRALYRAWRAGTGVLAAFPSPTAPHIRVGRQAHAIDVNALDGGETRLQRWLQSHGARATNPVAGEPWHLEVPEADLRRLARRLRRPYRLSWRAIRAVCPHLTVAQARRVADALGPAFAAHGITTRRRARMAVAQMAHESAGFRTTTEYATGAAYEGRRDLGNTHRGDGPRYRGRGYIQITGRANYAVASKALGHDFVARPADLARPRWAARASCWWWAAHGLNEIADRGDIVAATRRINGGLNGLADRRALYRRTRGRGRALVPKRRSPR